MSEEATPYEPWSHTDPILVQAEGTAPHRDVCHVRFKSGGAVVASSTSENVLTGLEEALRDMHEVNIARSYADPAMRPYVWDEALLLRRVGEIITRNVKLDGCYFSDPCHEINGDFPALPCLRLARGSLTRWVMPVGLNWNVAAAAAAHEQEPPTNGPGLSAPFAWGWHTLEAIQSCGYVYGPLQAAADALGDLASHEISAKLLAELDPDGGA